MPDPFDESSARALGRATLARQGLLERWDCGVGEAVSRLGGLQVQVDIPIPTGPIPTGPITRDAGATEGRTR